MPLGQLIHLSICVLGPSILHCILHLLSLSVEKETSWFLYDHWILNFNHWGKTFNVLVSYQDIDTHAYINEKWKKWNLIFYLNKWKRAWKIFSVVHMNTIYQQATVCRHDFQFWTVLTFKSMEGYQKVLSWHLDGLVQMHSMNCNFEKWWQGQIVTLHELKNQ